MSDVTEIDSPQLSPRLALVSPPEGGEESKILNLHPPDANNPPARRTLRMTLRARPLVEADPDWEINLPQFKDSRSPKLPPSSPTQSMSPRGASMEVRAASIGRVTPSGSLQLRLRFPAAVSTSTATPQQDGGASSPAPDQELAARASFGVPPEFSLPPAIPSPADEAQQPATIPQHKKHVHKKKANET
eukprot:PhM_4_TR1970/c0_g1_i1/m.43794